MKIGMSIGKVKKFGIGWCVPHRVAADNAEGGSGPGWSRVKINLTLYFCFTRIREM
jgi:hypothetical protein